MYYSLVAFVMFLASLPAFGGSYTRTSIAQILNDPTLKSVNGHSIEVYTVTPHKRPPAGEGLRFLIQGGLHGNEILTTDFVLWLRDRLIRGESPLVRLSPNTIFDLIPAANPDSQGHRRLNARNVNLNRNFSVNWGTTKEPAGKKAFSEPETRALKALMTRQRYVAAIDIHGYVNWIVLPSLSGNAQVADLRHGMWARAAARHAPMLDQVQPYEIHQAMNLGDGGAFEDWAFWANGSFALCLEMASEQRLSTGTRPTDSFLVYERFIYSMLNEAIALNKVAVPGWTGP